MKPHDKIAGWLVDDDGNIFSRVTEFTCPNHPHGPPDREWDEFTACERIVHYLFHDEPTALKHHGLADEARIELGLCCAGHHWHDTGELRRVSALEIFMRLNAPPLVDLRKSILFDELNRFGAVGDWQGVRIPLILEGTRLPRSAAAEAALAHGSYSLDPSKPPTVE